MKIYYGLRTTDSPQQKNISTVAAVIPDTVADESKKKMADGVARSPSRLCSRDGKIFVAICGDALVMILLPASVPFFLLLVFLFFLFLFFFPASRYEFLRRVPWSVQQPSATLTGKQSALYVLQLCSISGIRQY